MFTFSVRYLSSNSHRGGWSLGLSKIIPHLYEFLRGSWQPFWGDFQTIFLRPHLIGQKIGKIQPSRRRIYNLFTKFNSPPTYKDKNSAKYPLVKNIPHLYPWNSGFEYPFSKIFIVYLHLRAVWKRPHLIAIEKQKINPFFTEKICPSPICKKMGFWKGVLENDLQFVYKNCPRK